MKNILIILGILLTVIILSGCSKTNQLTNKDQNVPPTEAPPNITKVKDLTNDCSKVVLPTNVERNTGLDIEKEIITVSWLDPTTAEDVGVMYRYTDQNCSESAKEMTDHLLEDAKE